MKKEIIKGVMNAAGKGIDMVGNLNITKKKCGAELSASAINGCSDALKTIFEYHGISKEELDMIREYTYTSELVDKIRDTIYEELCEEKPDFDRIAHLKEMCSEIVKEKSDNENRANSTLSCTEDYHYQNIQKTIVILGSTIGLTIAGATVLLRLAKRFI